MHRFMHSRRLDANSIFDANALRAFHCIHKAARSFGTPVFSDREHCSDDFLDHAILRRKIGHSIFYKKKKKCITGNNVLSTSE